MTLAAAAAAQKEYAKTVGKIMGPLHQIDFCSKTGLHTNTGENKKPGKNVCLYKTDVQRARGVDELGASAVAFQLICTAGPRPLRIRARVGTALRAKCVTRTNPPDVLDAGYWSNAAPSPFRKIYWRTGR